MNWTSLNDQGWAGNQREKALVVVVLVHLIELHDSAEHLRVIVVKILRHLLEPGMLPPKSVRAGTASGLPSTLISICFRASAISAVE